MSVSMLASVFTNANRSGTARLFGVSTSRRYTAVPISAMHDHSIYRNLSSATVYASSSADATLILFAPLLPWFDSNYTGRFLQITNRRGSGSQIDINRFSDFGFNDQPTSMLLVVPNRGTDVRLSFRDLFLAEWRSQIDAQLRDGARREGDPTLTWEMWPQGISYLSSDRIYLKIHQRLRIEIDWWPDYDASITYHIFLYLTGAGRLRGYVARWAYWVEGGAKSGTIADRLEPAVIAGMDSLDRELNDRLSALSSFTFRDLYYLPGNQTSRPPNGALSGLTTSDVTIVVQT